MRERTTLAWLGVALAVWATATLYFRREAIRTGPSWQRQVSELSPEQQRFETSLRQELGRLEEIRSRTRVWPELETFKDWRLMTQGLYVNYVGPAQGLRWLVLIIEPTPGQPAEPSAVDDEHHQLGDGTLIHVTVWVQPLSEQAPQTVSPFPAAEGWVEVVREWKDG